MNTFGFAMYILRSDCFLGFEALLLLFLFIDLNLLLFTSCIISCLGEFNGCVPFGLRVF